MNLSQIHLCLVGGLALANCFVESASGTERMMEWAIRIAPKIAAVIDDMGLEDRDYSWAEYQAIRKTIVNEYGARLLSGAETLYESDDALRAAEALLLKERW